MAQSRDGQTEGPPLEQEPEFGWEAISDEGRRQRKVSTSEIESLRRELRAQEATEHTQADNDS